MRFKFGHRKITMTLTQTICPSRIALRVSKKKGGVRSADVEGLVPVLEKNSYRTQTQTLMQKHNTNSDI